MSRSALASFTAVAQHEEMVKLRRQLLAVVKQLRADDQMAERKGVLRAIELLDRRLVAIAKRYDEASAA